MSTDAAAALPASPGSRRLWRNRDYLFWLGSDTGATLGFVLYGFISPLIALIVLDDPVAAGVVAASGQAARVGVILPGGVLCDRYDRKRLIFWGGLLGAAIAAAFVVVDSLDRLEFWALTMLSVAMGLRNGLLGAAPNSALKSVVTTGQLPTALSANQARDGAIQIGAAPLGGVLLAIGPLAALLAPLIAFAGSALSACGIRTSLHPRASEQASTEPVAGGASASASSTHHADRGGGMIREAREGLAWLWQQPVLRGVLFASTLVNLGSNAAITTLIFAFQQEGLSPAKIGLVSSALGVAMIAGALVAPWLVNRVRTGLLVVGGLVPAVTAMFVLPAVDGIPATVLVLALGWLTVPAVNAGLLGYAMAIIPQRLMGRAMTGFDLFAMGAVPLAPVIAGFGLGWIGRDATLLICAGVCLVALVLAVCSRHLRRLPRPSDWPSVR